MLALNEGRLWWWYVRTNWEVMEEVWRSRPTWQWLSSLVDVGSHWVSEQPSGLASHWLKPSVRNCLVNLHETYFSDQAGNQNSSKEAETKTTLKKKSPKAFPHTWHSHKHLLLLQFFLLLKKKESISRSLEQLLILNQIQSNKTFTAGPWMGKH